MRSYYIEVDKVWFVHTNIHEYSLSFGIYTCVDGAIQLTVKCNSTHPVTVRSLPSLWHAHHPNVVGGASLQCSQDGGCTTDSPHLQGPFWWGVHLPWLSGVFDSVGHSSPSKSLPRYCQSWRSILHTRSDTDTCHFTGGLSSRSGSSPRIYGWSSSWGPCCCDGRCCHRSELIGTALASGTCTCKNTKQGTVYSHNITLSLHMHTLLKTITQVLTPS